MSDETAQHKAQKSVKFVKFIKYKVDANAFHFITFNFITLYYLYVSCWEEGEDDARSACPFDTLGCTLDTMAMTTGRDGVTLS